MTNSEMLPLEGFSVGVTADRRGHELTELLSRLGSRVIQGPSIHTVALVADDALANTTTAVIANPPDVTVVTTAIGLRSWFSAAGAWNLDDDLAAALGRSRIVARGPKSLGAVRALGLDAAWQEESERLANLVVRLGPWLGPGVRVVVQIDGGHDSAASESIRATGAEVVEVRSYRWNLPPDPRPALRLIRLACESRLDAIAFTSPPAVHNLFELAANEGLTDRLSDAVARGMPVVACVGPATAEAARHAGIAAPVFPDRGRLGLLIRTITRALGGHRHELTIDNCRLVIQGATVRIDDTTATLTDKERRLLALLLDNAGSIVSNERLLWGVWGEAGNEHILDVTLARLRRRLGPAGAAVHRVPRRGLWIEAPAMVG